MNASLSYFTMTRRDAARTLDELLHELLRPRRRPLEVNPIEFRLLVGHFLGHEHDRARRLRATRSDRFTLKREHGKLVEIERKRELNASNGITLTDFAKERGIARAT